MTVKSWIEVGTLAAMIVSAVLFFETSEDATAQYETLAADREVGDLRTRLDLVKLKIQRLVDLSQLRPLTTEETVELRSLEAERDLLLDRLTKLGEI